MSILKIYKIKDILKELEHTIENKMPFSLLRMGDGGVKLIHALIYNDKKQLDEICIREGIPKDKILEVFELWGKYVRQANFIDCPEVYFTDKFWGKYKKGLKEISKKTIERMLMWKDLYSRAEFDNEKYCNPEINYLVCLRIGKRKNLLDIIKDKKICCISTYNEINLPFDITSVKIAGHFENQYENSFEQTISFINENATKYDIFLVSAGELGRIYTGYIKQKNGRSFDLGFVIDYWMTGYIPDRLINFIEKNEDNPLEFKLTEDGDKYLKYL